MNYLFIDFNGKVCMKQERRLHVHVILFISHSKGNSITPLDIHGILRFYRWHSHLY